MKIIIIGLCLIFNAITAVGAADLFDLRVFPSFENSRVAVAGIIVTSSLKENPTSRRNHFSGLLGRWLASSTITIKSADQTITLPVSNGEFSGELRVSSLASFTLSVLHEEQLLHQETFNFPEKIDAVVVSDIDDTILVTEVTRRLKMVYNSLLKQHKNREAVAGTSEFYQQIQQGKSVWGTPHFVYLSSSPAFLSRQIKAFIAGKKFPQGTIILKKSVISGDHQSHKSGWLKEIAGKYPQKPLILIGDSGEKDPDIYSGMAHDPDYQKLIRCIIIHEVTSDPEKLITLTEMQKQLQAKHIPLIFWDCIAELKKELKQQKLLP